MIYDCFLFFNELDLLEIRLNELSEVVDKFVLIECSKTFSSKEKPLYFEENKARFEKFLDKIIHIKVFDLPHIPPKAGRMETFHNRHDVEAFQRNCISRGLKDCKPDDIIMISDADEIPEKNSILKAAQLLSFDKDLTVTFIHKFYYYFINALCISSNKQPIIWHGTTLCRFGAYPGSQVMRDKRSSAKHILPNSGWHFSYLGGAESIAYKIESFAHAEFDNDYIKNKERLNKAINEGKDIFDRANKQAHVFVNIDDSYPQYILSNLEKFSYLIKGTST
jgi:beta-1,4-mannosyl-glycoprotein beta-1,4-N-acetylglucosaminyltransferase